MNEITNHRVLFIVLLAVFLLLPVQGLAATLNVTPTLEEKTDIPVFRLTGGQPSQSYDFQVKTAASTWSTIVTATTDVAGAVTAFPAARVDFSTFFLDPVEGQYAMRALRTGTSTVDAEIFYQYGMWWRVRDDFQDGTINDDWFHTPNPGCCSWGVSEGSGYLSFTMSGGQIAMALDGVPLTYVSDIEMQMEVIGTSPSVCIQSGFDSTCIEDTLPARVSVSSGNHTVSVKYDNTTRTLRMLVDGTVQTTVTSFDMTGKILVWDVSGAGSHNYRIHDLVYTCITCNWKNPITGSTFSQLMYRSNAGTNFVDWDSQATNQSNADFNYWYSNDGETRTLAGTSLGTVPNSVYIDITPTLGNGASKTVEWFKVHYTTSNTTGEFEPATPFDGQIYNPLNPFDGRFIGTVNVSEPGTLYLVLPQSGDEFEIGFINTGQTAYSFRVDDSKTWGNGDWQYRLRFEPASQPGDFRQSEIIDFKIVQHTHKVTPKSPGNVTLITGSPTFSVDVDMSQDAILYIDIDGQQKAGFFVAATRTGSDLSVPNKQTKIFQIVGGNLSDGPHNWRARIQPFGRFTDGIRPNITSTTTFFRVYTGPPEANLTLLTPASGASFSTSLVGFSYTVQTNVTGTVNILIDGSIKASDAILTPGTYTLNKSLTVPAGNHEWAIQFVSDTTTIAYTTAGRPLTINPVVSFIPLSPADNAVFANPPVVFRSQLNRSQGLAGTVSFFLDGVEQVSSSLSQASSDRSDTVTFTIDTIAVGRHSWFFRYTDSNAEVTVDTQTRAFTISTASNGTLTDPGLGTGGQIVPVSGTGILGRFAITPLANIFGVNFATTQIILAALISLGVGTTIAMKTRKDIYAVVAAGAMMVIFSFIGWLPAFVGVAIILVSLAYVAYAARGGGGST